MIVVDINAPFLPPCIIRSASPVVLPAGLVSVSFVSPILRFFLALLLFFLLPPLRCIPATTTTPSLASPSSGWTRTVPYATPRPRSRVTARPRALTWQSARPSLV